MKRKKIELHLFSFLLILLSISSCKKDNSHTDNSITNKTDNEIKIVSVAANGIAEITTSNGSHYSQNLSTTSSKGNVSILSTDKNGDSILSFILPMPRIGTKSGGDLGTNLVDPNSPGGGGGFQPITAYITSVNGFDNVTLSSYSQYYNGITLTATVYGLVSNSYGGSFFVQYVQTSGGVVVGSSSTEYYYHW